MVYKTKLSCTTNQVAEVTLPSGNLASMMLEDTGVGGKDCSWRLIAKPGQTIDLMAYSYVISSLTTTNLPSGVNSDGPTCYTVAFVREVGEVNERISVCKSDTQRLKPVYRSKLNTIDVEFTSFSTQRYLLTFKGKLNNHASTCSLCSYSHFFML